MLSSCDNFFSKSWGKPREYDPGKINLTPDNLQHFTEVATGNPELAGALVEKIIKELPNKTGDARAAFQEAGIKLAVEQAGVGTEIIKLAGDALTGLGDEDEEGLKNLLVKVLDIAESANDAAGNIATIVMDDTKGASTFTGGSSYWQKAKPSDVGMAIMVLSLGILADEGKEIDDVKDNDVNDWFDNLQIAGKNVIIKESSKSKSEKEKEKALAAYLNLIANDTTGKFSNNPITRAIQGAFDI
jgi:hypothetical protein